MKRLKKRKVRLRDYELDIANINEEINEVHAKLTNKDTTSEQRKALREERGELLEQQQTAIRTRNEYTSGIVPGWLIGLIGTGLSALSSWYVFKKVLHLETDGEGIFSGQAVNLWDKVTKKF